MFPETSWTTIRSAGEKDRSALERFAERYREPVRSFIRKKGLPEADADDLCQEVFLRVLKSETLASAAPSRGRFRSLLLAIASHVVVDHFRKKKHEPRPEEVDPAAPERDEDFDREWVLHLSERALARLREESPGYHAALKEHLDGKGHDRQKVWIARKKLIALIRDEVARTCSSQTEFEEEVGYLSGFLSKKV